MTALTWGHAARRLFVGVGGSVCTARVWRVVAPLQLLARVRAAQALRHPRLAAKLPLPPRLQPALHNLFAHTIRVIGILIYLSIYFLLFIEMTHKSFFIDAL